MKPQQYIDENEIRKTISVLKPDGQLFEIRILKNGDKGKSIISGYFEDVDIFLDKVNKVDLRDTNVYISLGWLNKALFSRQQRNTLRKISQTTSDSEVDGYQWFFVDTDPVRPTGVSSSEEEFEKSKVLAGKIAEYLKGLGFEEPVKAISGNGCHLLYNVQMQNTPENVKTIEKCLKVLAQLFDNDDVKVDTSNFNPARICKLHGTLAQKGANTKERPHRMSRIFSVPDEIRPTKTEYLKKLADELPDEPVKQYNNYNSGSFQKFDIEEWLDRYNIGYIKTQGDRSDIYRLDECPFDSSHRDGDSKIFVYSNGAIAFKCHHNSCSQYRWQDVREKFEPEAYNKPDFDSKYDDGWKQHNREKERAEIYKPEINIETDDDVLKIYRTASEIIKDPEPEYEYIKSGIKTIDMLMAGLAKTELTAISGLTGSGKSTLLAQIMLNAVNNEHRVVCYSGEMSNKKYLNWMLMQAAGKTNTIRSQKVDGEYLLKSDDIQQRICNWMGDNFRLYDNRQGNNFVKIRKSLEQVLKQTKADLCVIDNLMILDLSTLDKDKYEAQTRFVISLKDLALKTNTHIIFVAHPRKTNGFLKLSDIAGSSNIGNILDNGFVVHRCNAGFVNGYMEEYKQSPWDTIDENATNCIEIVKDREHGNQNRFISLFYEYETKRLKNSMTENVTYEW